MDIMSGSQLESMNVPSRTPIGIDFISIITNDTALSNMYLDPWGVGRVHR
jgi:hypothetical protein